ncbi:hypothetical protein GCM10007160_28240 [Litchfieldella qijiaojingensis]|uniref:Uncharacterized protein n=1 Tax=Litchfieldella qijiaojingensis TaxID=980347 RepID=A0ABQ2YXV0_9GAMM|nr:retron St85 family effector protein [Halomonas qijiaojingensis]GGX98847.1 hypothetical protein GCM10007160_28240 [Halomonas qijiaojingensis]
MSSDSADNYHLDVLSKLDLKKSRFALSTSPIVLLCGGKVSDSPHISSFRHALTNYMPPPRYEFFRPEEITDWKDDGVFNDLLDFEKELGSICSLVVVVLESEGAFAELGAFSQMHDLKAKICAINSQEYHGEDSFINLGILRHIKKETKIDVKVYPWDVKNPANLEDEVVQDAIDDIGEQLKKTRKPHAFSGENGAHVMALITEFIKVFVALKEHEILDYLDLLDIKIKRESLRRKLFILERFRIIVKGVYSDSSFYMRSGTDFNRIKFHEEDGFVYDDLRISLRCKELYQADRKHRHRMRVIKAQEGSNG